MKLNFINIMMIVGSIATVSSCTKHPDSPGYEYMPDMYRSQAIEAYVDYGMVRDDVNDTLKNTISARKPVDGTIAFNADPVKAKIFMPYALTNSEADYNKSKWLRIPKYFISSEEVALAHAEEGKKLYSYFCQHCHGEKGMGDGGVITVGGYNQPNPYNGGYKDRTIGQIFHVITHGKGAMGPHGSQLNKEERWKVALYVRTLQHGELLYSDLLPKYKKVGVDSVMIDIDSLSLPMESIEDVVAQ
jgi:mono/diheme cytochrome c family protein